MQMLTVDPGDLEPNPWNSNRLTPDAEAKLRLSITRIGMFKPIIARRLPNGSLQVLGGQHRAQAAVFVGMAEVPVIDLGAVDDQRAKEIGIIDNGRYGHDDADLLAKLLEELGDPADLALFMPFDLAELDAMSAVCKIDLDNLELEAEDAAPVEKRESAPKTHTTMRFRVPIENQHLVESVIKDIIAGQEFEDSDAMINAGDALVWLASFMSAYKADES